MKYEELSKKIKDLQDLLHRLETVEKLRITSLMIESDMGDDFRENEAAKLAIEEHRMWTVRRQMLRMEIIELKRKAFALKMR